MRPADIQVIGDQLAVKWDDGSETFLALEKMRRHCPCASCAGETATRPDSIRTNI